MAAHGTGGTVYNPNAKKPKRHPNQHAGGSAVAHPAGRPYQWANGSFHTRKQGKRFRSTQPHGHSGGGNGTGGTPAPAAPKPKKDPLTRLASRYANMAYGQTLGAVNNDLSNTKPYFQDFINHVNQSNQLYTQQSQPILQQAQQQQQTAGQVVPGTEQSPEAQLAAQSRSALAGLGLSTLQGIVSANQGYFAGQAGPVAAAGQLQMQTNLGKEKRQVLRERGNYQATKREELRQTQHKVKLENKAFGLDVQQEKNKQANNAANRRQKNRSQRLARQASRKANRVKGSQARATYIAKYGIAPEAVADGLTPAERRQMKRYRQNGGGSAGGASFTPVQRQKTKVDVRKGLDLVRSELKGKNTAPTGFWDKAYRALVDNKGYDPLLARAVIQIARRGRARSGVAHRVRQNYGIGLPKGKKMHVPPPFTATPAPQAPAGSVGGTGEQRPT